MKDVWNLDILDKRMDRGHVLEGNPRRLAKSLDSGGRETHKVSSLNYTFWFATLDRKLCHSLKWKHRRKNRFEDECRVGVGNHESVLGLLSLSETPWWSFRVSISTVVQELKTVRETKQ